MLIGIPNSAIKSFCTHHSANQERHSDDVASSCANAIHCSSKLEVLMARRSFLRQLVALPLVGMTSWGQEATHKSLNIMMKSAWGSDDPTKAAFPFLHGLALSEAGHDVQIFLLGEAVSLMRKSVATAVVPVGWPPLAEALDKVVAKHIQI